LIRCRTLAAYDPLADGMNMKGKAVKNVPAYPFLVGMVECCILSDGPLDLGIPEKVFTGADMSIVEDALRRNFLSTERVLVEQNIVFLKIDKKNVLIETGIGGFRWFGDRAGKLLGNLIKAGIDPLSIDAILCSHPHPDHIGGLCNVKGKPLFPNASIFLARNDFTFWTDEALLGRWADIAVHAARANLFPLRDRLVFIDDGDEPVRGITAHFTPGHTQEHICFEIRSNGESLFLIGDLAHHVIISLEIPTIKFAADLDPDLAAKTRARIFAALAADRTRVLGYHFPWPGLGRIEKNEQGFRFIAEPVRW
jgi:glyoxylase-like metal-dependent hydrolase (beta-lactamase superfamily II)